IYSVRGSIAFEREGMLAGTGYTQTLEPTFSYVHVPFERQNHLPVFDSGLADFSMSQIFSENIFSGGDRINDSDQLTIGVSSKFLDLNSGAERFKLTVAQRFHLDEELVVINSTDAPRTANRSDILLEAGGKITDRVNASSLMQYSAILDEVVRQEQRLQYAPESGKVLNMLYRYSRDNHEQYDISGQWPIKGRWGVAGRWNYSRDSSKLLEGVGGLEYKVGCWAFRFVANRFLSGQDALGKDLYTTGFFVQLELQGVTNIGSNAIGELRRSIPGYSSN
ncbi:MAG: LPS-assembly protein LptD, partial [Betaproteobacteria bacterium]